jgi:DNA-binding transcriptional MerR regulator
MDARWPLDELTRRCGEALSRADLRQENGQVADVPNGRAIRWYSSIGLLARPEQRGRVAFYGPHHLQQLVAIKRLQAEGLALSAVQQALAGKSNDDVAALAAVPADLVEDLVADPAVGDTVTVNGAAPYRPFWAADVADADIMPGTPVAAAPVSASSAPSVARVAVDVAGVTVVVPGVDAALLPELHDAVRGFVRTLVARGLLATSPAPTSSTQDQENER